MSGTFQSNKQRQIPQSTDLARSFKTTTNLAAGLTKDRVTIQNELQKIGQTKSLLEEMRIASTSKKAEPILTTEEKASKVNKAEIKGTGFQMTMVQSQKGAEMIEAQRDSRRQRHIACLKECEKFVEQFYDNFSEKKSEIKERIKVFFERSDIEIDSQMEGLSDELLLAHEIGYVNGVWEKVTNQRNNRNAEVQSLRDSLDNLKAFQQKGSGSYIGGMRQKLIDIAFYLEPQVDELMKQQISDEESKYAAEHQDCDEFYNGIVIQETEKFDILYTTWKAAVVRFHKLKQEDAIKKFVDRLNSKEFVNAQSRVDIFNNMKIEQDKLYKQRISLVDQLNDTHPKLITKELVSNISDQLGQFNEESSIVFDSLVSQLTKDMENTNEDIDIALYDVKDFIIKNDAELEEGLTFDLIIEKRCTPYVERRKLESKTLIMNAIGYQEDFDYKMSEITQNVVNFFKEFATSLDKNKEKLKQTEINFQVALANCGDHHDDIILSQEDELSKKVVEMERAIHHVMLNEKLQDCFDLLDQIQRTYRNYNDEYIKIAQNYPNQMDTFYIEFEQDSLGVFKRFPEEQRERIQELFTKETEDAQAKLEAEALKKWEDDKKADEAKLADDAKKAAADPKAKKAAPPKGKGGKDADKPNLDVPKLEVPGIADFTSKMEMKYCVERSIEDITTKLLTPAPLEDENPQAEGDDNEKLDDDSKRAVSPDAGREANASKTGKGGAEVPADGEEEEEEPVEQWPTDVVVTDFIEKADMKPPQDPEGENTLYPDLTLTRERMGEILEKAITVVMDWLVSEKKIYRAKCQAEGRQLQDQSVEELDENLRKQWPRKGRLEVEIYQERKSQVTNHNRKYERQVRSCLEKYNGLEDEWGIILDRIQEEFESFQNQVKKLKENLPLGKNLAQLQGTSRREKDASQQFEEKCRELKEQLDELSCIQPDNLIKNNNDMLLSCQLFDNGGNYDTAEIAWYQGQMDEINTMITTCKDTRLVSVGEMVTEMDRLLEEPGQEFSGEYKNSIEELSAKDGLGKTYGQPRRFAQERLRSEMTRCEEAQKGVDKILDKLEALCHKSYNDYTQGFDYSKEKLSLSIEIRINFVSLVRMMIHYGKHMGGFKEGNVPEDLPRISYLETQEPVELQESEIEIDATRKADELEHLGPIGFKNSNEEYKQFPEAIMAIDQTCRDLVTKLYTGDNAKHLVGDQKIPEYLSNFLANMHRQVEEFKINCVRQLRTTSERLTDLCQQVPRSVFNYVHFKYQSIILNQMGKVTQDFQAKQQQDKDRKEEHLKLFKPNLANPANKEATKQLNEDELKRSAEFRDLVDDTQLKLLTIEEENSLQFYTAYLNNVRALIQTFDRLLPKTGFVMLPGDEIVEKKHANIKMLTAQMESADLSKRKTRKWPGLGPAVFEVDYASLFEEYKDFGAVVEGEENVPKQKEDADNEIGKEVEVLNTPQHKAIVKARNEYYTLFKDRFEKSIQSVMSEYDNYRKEDVRFSEYWANNLKEITRKHI